MLEKYISQLDYKSQEDFKKHFKINIPNPLNFGYDIVDEWQ